MLREIFSDFIKAIVNPIQLGMLCIGLLLTVFVIVPVFSGCDSASANPFQKLYYDQIVITDSVKAQVRLLMDSIDSVSAIAHRKITALQFTVSQRDAQIVGLNTTIAERDARIAYLLTQVGVCDTGVILRAYGVQLTEHLFIPLHNRLTQIIDSLNRR